MANMEGDKPNKVSAKSLKKSRKPEVKDLDILEMIDESFPSDEDLQSSKASRKEMANRIAEKGGELGFPGLGAGAATLVDLSADLIPESREQYKEDLVGSMSPAGILKKVPGGRDTSSFTKKVKELTEQRKAGMKDNLDKLDLTTPENQKVLEEVRKTQMEIPDEYLPTEDEMKAALRGESKKPEVKFTSKSSLDDIKEPGKILSKEEMASKRAADNKAVLESMRKGKKSSFEFGKKEVEKPMPNQADVRREMMTPVEGGASRKDLAEEIRKLYNTRKNKKD
jgi:hypothetical protein